MIAAISDLKVRRPLLRYHGGKWVIGRWIVGFFPQHKKYVEPYCGAASVLLRKDRVYQEVINDLDHDVVNLFRVLRDETNAGRLAEQLRLTPYAREEFEAAYDETDEPVEKARRFMVRSFMGFGSASGNNAHATGFRGNSYHSGVSTSIDWMHLPDGLPAAVDRLRGVVVESRAALKVIETHDAAETLFYVDPPYPHSTRGFRPWNPNYRHEMTDEEHIELSRALHRCEGMVAISGYACELYEDLYCTWERHDLDTHADGARDRIETVWLSPALSERRAGSGLFAGAAS